MDSLFESVFEILQIDPVQRIGGFVLFLFLSILAGAYTPKLVNLITARFFPRSVASIYSNLVRPLERLFRIAGTLVLISLSLVWIQRYDALYSFVKPFMDLAVIISLAWLTSRFFRQFVHVYGIDMLRRFGREVDDLLLVSETLANTLIGLIAVLAFAQSQQFNLVGLLASLGIGGVAVSLAAQKILEQLLSTIVIYLDRPFTPGDYIRLTDGQLGRIESIGLRSTKIRTAAKSTLLVVPNSNLINSEIENLTLAKKVMVLLYLDFMEPLREQDSALVQQVIKQGTDTLFGIDPGSTQISLIRNPQGEAARARVTFFILGSGENSIQLRKRLLELANEKVSKQLSGYGIHFNVQDPTIYVESPVTV